MADVRQILVPVDFSESSEAALDYASNLANVVGGTLDVLHVCEMPGFTPPVSMVVEGVSLADWAQKNARESLDRLVAEASSRGITIRDALTELGRPAATIVEVATAKEYDLIVLGTHGRVGLSRILLGSVAESVVRHAACPVLTVRARSNVEK